MCELVSIFLFIAALAVQFGADDFNKFICLAIASGIFAIAGSIYSLKEKDSITINTTLKENDKK